MSALPQPTADMARAKDDLDKHGYCFVADALTGDALREARERLIEQAEAEQRLGIAHMDSGVSQKIVDENGRILPNAFTREQGGVNQRIWMLVNKGQCFRDMVIHPVVDELVAHLLGDTFLLSALTANITHPGGVRMGLHTDQWWLPVPARPEDAFVRPANISRRPDRRYLEPDPALGIMPPVVVNTMWMLGDFTIANGATEVVPGSHVSGAHPGDPSRCHIVHAEAPAGTLMVFDGRLWHGTGANTGTDSRLGVIATFCAPQFRQQENYTVGLDRALWPKLNEKLLMRLGFANWNGYGRVESPTEVFLRPDLKVVGELH